MATVVPATRLHQGAGHDNSFDALRLGAAIAVVVGHGFVLTNNGPAPKVGGVPIHALGVDVFFVLSGYLISDSWLRDPDLRRYLVRRLLRIMPGLACVVLTTVLVLGPMVTTAPMDQYWTSTITWSYLQNLALVGIYHLPGVFTAGHWTSAVNGCLWTLGLEFIAYVFITAGIAFPRRRATAPILALLALGIVLVVNQGVDTGLGAAGRVWIYFAAGALARHHFPRAAYKSTIAVPLLWLWLAAGFVSPSAGTWLSWVAVPYLTLTLGLSTAAPGVALTRLGDLSYGAYLWGFPVQQIVIERFGNLPLTGNLPVVLTCTLGIAWLSWHNIEARALEHKPRRTVIGDEHLRSADPGSGTEEPARSPELHRVIAADASRNDVRSLHRGT